MLPSNANINDIVGYETACTINRKLVKAEDFYRLTMMIAADNY